MSHRLMRRFQICFVRTSSVNFQHLLYREQCYRIRRRQEILIDCVGGEYFEAFTLTYS